MLKKLSLAALVAMGSMSFASATDLSSAIQGVQLNGFLRVRAYYDAQHTPDNASLDANNKESNYRRWRTNAKLVFGVPVAENTKMVVRISAQQDYDTTGTEATAANSTGTFSDSLFFVNYAKDGIAANVGVIPLGFLPYASSDEYRTAHGAGADATYTTGDLTVAAGYVDHLWNANVLGGQIDNDVYTLGAIYKNKEVGSAQLWYAKIHHVLDNDIMLMTNLNILKDQGIGVKFDIAQSKLDDFYTTTKAQVHRYYNLAFSAKVAGIDAIIGFAKTNNRAGTIATDSDAKIGHVPGMELRKNIANEQGAKAVYAKLGYDVTEKANVYVAFNNIAQDDDGNTHGQKAGNSKEYKLGTSYKVNKKFGVSGYVDAINYADSAQTDQKEARVQFKYSF